MTTVNSLDAECCKTFLAMDKSLVDDFVTCAREGAEDIENCVSSLKTDMDEEYIHRIYRAVHSLKGNCQMVNLDPISDLLHHLEETISGLRSRQLAYNPNIGTFIQLVSDEVQILIEKMVSSHYVDNHLYRLLHTELLALSKIPVAERGDSLQQTIAVFSGTGIAKEPVKNSGVIDLTLPSDIELMRGFSGLLDNLSIYRRDRTQQICQLVSHLNDAVGQPVDPQQLQAAALMHDIGMGFVTPGILNKEGALTKEELKQIQQHVKVSWQLLKRFGGWEEAATIVLHHHERYDGKGYPNNLAGDNIHIGARFLAIVDTYCSITNERSDRNFKKSVLSAISEINANKGTQFDAELVEAFNEVIRQQLIVKH